MKKYNIQFFTKKERRSFLFLALAILMLLCVLFYVYKYDKPEKYFMDDIVPREIIDSLDKTNPNLRPKRNLTNSSESKNPNKSFKFNPNKISIDSLKMLGVDQFASSNLDKYRKKGGVIKNNEQFFKIYGMEKYKTKLDSLISLENSSISKKYNEVKKDSFTQKSKSYQNDASKIQVVKIKITELNEADSFELESIKGIGALLASRIVKYRNRLGGFYEVEQLEEVYGLRAETYMNISHLVKVNPDLIKKIEINKIEEKALASHPYIGWKTSSILMRYKKQHGDFKSLDDIKKVRIFDEEDLEKLKWYLSF